jgi:hypothetical protein
MVAEIEGANAGAGGPGASSGVKGPAAPAGDDNPFPLIGAQQGDDSPDPGDDGGGAQDELEAAVREDRENRGIPHDRVRQMRASWEKRAREAAMAETRESILGQLAPAFEELKQLRELSKEFDPAAVKTGVAEAFLDALGVTKKPPPPKYVTSEDLEKILHKQREEQNAARELEQDVSRARRDLDDGMRQHEKLLKHFPVLREAAIAIWGSPYAKEKKISMGAILKQLVAQVEKGVGTYNEAYAKEKENDREVVPISGAGGPKPPPKKPEKQDFSDEATAERARSYLRKARSAG